MDRCIVLPLTKESPKHERMARVAELHDLWLKSCSTFDDPDSGDDFQSGLSVKVMLLLLDRRRGA